MERLGLLVLCLVLSAPARPQPLPYSFQKSKDATKPDTIDATAVQEDLEFLANQVHQQKVVTSNLTINGVVVSVGATTPLCSSGGANPSISFCGNIAESQVTNLVSDLAAKASLVALTNFETAVAASTAAIAASTTSLAAGGATTYLLVNGTNAMTGPLTALSSATIQDGTAGGLLVAGDSVTASAFFGYGGALVIPSNFGWVTDNFLPSANGSQKTFTLSQVPTSSASLRVVLNNLVKNPVLDYTYSATVNSFTFSSIAPSASSRNFYASYSTGTVVGNGGSQVVSTQALLGPTGQNIRFMGTVYHSTSTYPIQVAVTVNAVNTGGEGIEYDFSVLTDTSSTPTSVVEAPFFTGNNTLSANGAASVYFAVLPGNYYEVTGTGSLAYWTEWK